MGGREIARPKYNQAGHWLRPVVAWIGEQTFTVPVTNDFNEAD
jgi:hypothetical protein